MLSGLQAWRNQQREGSVICLSLPAFDLSKQFPVRIYDSVNLESGMYTMCDLGKRKREH